MILRRRWLHNFILLIFWPLGYVLSSFTAYYPEYVEKYYALGFSSLVSKIMSSLTGKISFSLSEVIVWSIVIAFVLKLMIVLITKMMGVIRRRNSSPPDKGKRILGKEEKSLFYLLYNTLVLLGVIYFCFMLVWGLNYNRLAFAEISGLEVQNVSEEELVQLSDKLITKANNLRSALVEDEKGIMKNNGGFEYITKSAVAAYAEAEKIYPELGGEYSRPKPVFFSRLMSYTGISGIYFPFTSEANVNVDIPASMLPVTTCHEMAHQRGFAREDESNYIAWVTSNCSDNPEFQYSGTLLALIHSINALYTSDQEKARFLQAKFSDEVKRDLKAISDYWEQYEGKVEEVTSEINDTYLKSNGQKDGVKSYGRMVDLLIAEQKAAPKKKFLP